VEGLCGYRGLGKEEVNQNPNVVFKGRMSRDEYFFDGPPWMSADVFFTIFGCLLWRKSKIKFLLASLTHILIVKNLPVTLFRELVMASDSWLWF
jgi:hypothetical protein